VAALGKHPSLISQKPPHHISRDSPASGRERDPDSSSLPWIPPAVRCRAQEPPQKLPWCGAAPLWKAQQTDD